MNNCLCFRFPPDHNLVFIIDKSYWPSYHYLLPWDWKCGEFGAYEKGFITDALKVLIALGMITGTKTASDESVREALYQLSTTKKPIKEILEKIKETADYETARAELVYHH